MLGVSKRIWYSPRQDHWGQSFIKNFSIIIFFLFLVFINIGDIIYYNCFPEIIDLQEKWWGPSERKYYVISVTKEAVSYLGSSFIRAAPYCAPELAFLYSLRPDCISKKLCTCSQGKQYKNVFKNLIFLTPLPSPLILSVMLTSSVYPSHPFSIFTKAYIFVQR